METLVLTIHILIAVGLVITVLLQRSEGGGLGIGGSGAGGLYDGARNSKFANKGYNHFGRWFSTTIILAILAGVEGAISIVDDVIKKTSNSRWSNCANW